MKILITGGAGYLGYSLVEYLDKNPAVSEIIVFDNLSGIHSNFFIGRTKFSKVKFQNGDILNSYSLKKVIANADVVYHLAGHTAFPNNHHDVLRYEQINQWGTLNVVREIKEVSNVKKFIYLSSSSVYGHVENIQSDEKPQPQNPYSKSKFAGEGYLDILKNQCQIHIVRPGNIFGFNPSFRKDSVINNFIFGSIVYKKIFIYGSGKQQRPFIEINYLCEFLQNLLPIDNSTLTVSNIANFNANLIEIRDVLLQLEPNLEYQFLNQNISYPGHTYGTEFLDSGNLNEQITAAYQIFNQNLRL